MGAVLADLFQELLCQYSWSRIWAAGSLGYFVDGPRYFQGMLAVLTISGFFRCQCADFSAFSSGRGGLMVVQTGRIHAICTDALTGAIVALATGAVTRTDADRIFGAVAVFPGIAVGARSLV